MPHQQTPHNFLICEIWIQGEQQLLDNPVQELHIKPNQALSNSDSWLIFDEKEMEVIFIYLN